MISIFKDPIDRAQTEQALAVEDSIAKLKTEMLTEVPVVDYCNECYEELNLPNQKYCDNICATKHARRMASHGVKI